MNTHRSSHINIVLFVVLVLGTLFIAFPRTGSAHGDTHPAGTAHPVAQADITCMASAVDVRETALIAAWADLNTGVVAALEDRKDALQTAWGLTTLKERTTALVKAWKDWRAAKKAAYGEFKKDRKAAWDAFKKTAKSECKVTPPKDEALEKAASDAVAI